MTVEAPDSMSRGHSTRRVLLNSLSGALLYVVNLAIVFIVSPIMIRELGNRDYGIWEMLLSFCGYFGILELGLGPALIRYVAREEALGNRDALNRILVTGFWGLSAVGVAALAGMAALALVPEVVLGVADQAPRWLSLLFLIVGSNLAVQFLGTLFIAFLMGRQSHLAVNMIRCVLYPLQASVLVLALTRWDGTGLVHVATISLATNCLQYGIFALMVLQGSGLRLSRHGYSRATARELYRFGIGSVLLMAADRIQRQSLPIIIGHVLGAGFVVFFTMPMRLVAYARDLVMAVCVPLMPYLTALDAVRQVGKPMQQWIPLSRATFFLSAPGAVLLMLLGEPFLSAWIGPSYAIAGRWVIVALGASFLLTGVVANASRVLVAGARHGGAARQVLLISIVAIVAAVPATQRFGVTGAAVILALADLVASTVFWLAASRYLGVRFGEHVRQVVKPTLVPLLLMTGIASAGRAFWDLPNNGSILLVGLASITVYLIGYWVWALAPGERSHLLLRLARLREPEGTKS